MAAESDPNGSKEENQTTTCVNHCISPHQIESRQSQWDLTQLTGPAIFFTRKVCDVPSFITLLIPLRTVPYLVLTSYEDCADTIDEGACLLPNVANNRKPASWLKFFKQFLKNTYEGKNSDEFLSEDAKTRRRNIARWVYTVIFSGTLAVIVTIPRGLKFNTGPLRLGDIIEEDLISPISAEIEPVESSNTDRENLARRVPPVYNYDDRITERWLKRWEKAFEQIRSEYYSNDRKRAKNNSNILDAVSKKTFELTGQSLRPKEMFFLHDNKFSENIQKLFLKIGQEILVGRIISSSDLFPLHYSTGIVVRQLNQGLHETLIQDVTRIWSLDQAREVLQHPPGRDSKSKTLTHVLELVGNVIVPNLAYDEALTKKRIDSIIASTRQPILSVHEGQTILRKGDRVTEQQWELLQQLRNLSSFKASLKRLTLNFIIFIAFFSLLFKISLGRSNIWNLSFKDALFFFSISALSLILVKYVLPVTRLLFSQFGLSNSAEFILPFSSGGIILYLLMGTEAAYTFAFGISIVLGYMLDQNFFYSIWAFTCTATAIQSIGTCKERADLFKFGAFSGLLGAVLILAYSLLQSMGMQHVDWTTILATMVLSITSGLLSTVFTSLIIPFLEVVFGYTTSLKLLELSNFHHPLLHTLMMKAPGTYHHSVIVGSLAEIAADHIKANPLLARVAAYYHDIGKMTKPMYFIENQTPGNNPHDQLSPSMSAKILFSHVKNGVKLGKEYSLGAKIVDIIEQHHGTTVASFFYNKAKSLENPEVELVEESHFKYPGPKPQTREAGIVMLADACEAATRSISEPTPSKIQAMVHSIITKRFLEEQFTDCDLTISDLKIIEENFTRTLVSLYHHRIEYPGQKKFLNQTAADSSPKKSASS